MPSIKDILNSYNSINNNKPLTIKDLMVANANSQLQETPENLSPYPTNQPQIPLSQNIPIQSQYNIPTDKINIPSIAQNRIPISPEMEPYNKPPKPYSISDIASYWKADEKTGEKPSKWSAFLKSIGTLLNTKEGMNLIGLATLGTGGSPFMAKAFADQGSQIEAGNIQNKEQYNKYLENIRKTNTEYDMKLLDILGKEGYERLKGGKGLIFIDKTTMQGYLPITQEDGSIKNVPVNADEYVRNGYSTQTLFKPEIDEIERFKQKQNILTQETAKRAGIKGGIETSLITQKEIEKMKPGTPQYANLTTKLSDDYRGDIKDYSTLRQNFATMENVLQDSLKNPNKSMIAVDQALINTFNKMVDPNSVVRESEYARTGEGQSKLAEVSGYIDKLQKGGAGLTPENRLEMYNVASSLMSAANDYYKEKRKNYEDISKEYKVSPNLVIGKDLSYKPKKISINKKETEKIDKNIENFRNKYNY